MAFSPVEKEMSRLQRLFGPVVFVTGVSLMPGQTPLCAGMPDGPTITDPTAASCVYDATTNAAVISLNRAAVLDWSKANQGVDSSLTFNFAGSVANPTVLNRLGTLNPRLGDHRFVGSIQSNGRVVILSPRTSVSLGGDINVGELVAVVSEVTPAGEAALIRGNEAVEFITNDPAGIISPSRLLTVFDARITSTQGDVVLGSGSLVGVFNTSSRTSTIQSAGATRIFSGNRVRYDPSTSDFEQITPLAGNESNAIVSSGILNAGTNVEISSAETGQISIGGPITADDGNGRIFLRVNNGTIDLSSQSILAGTLETTGSFESVLVEGNEGDTPATSSPSVALFPSLRKGSATNREGERSKSVKVFQGAPVVASSEASRQQAGGSRQGARREKKGRGALVQRSGFFGLRSAKVSKRR